MYCIIQDSDSLSIGIANLTSYKTDGSTVEGLDFSNVSDAVRYLDKEQLKKEEISFYLILE